MKPRDCHQGDGGEGVYLSLTKTGGLKIIPQKSFLNIFRGNFYFLFAGVVCAAVVNQA